MLYQVSTVTRQHVDDGNLYHRVAARLQALGSASHVDQYLSCQSGVVNLHVKFQTLILRLSADTLAH